MGTRSRARHGEFQWISATKQTKHGGFNEKYEKPSIYWCCVLEIKILNHDGFFLAFDWFCSGDAMDQILRRVSCVFSGVSLCSIVLLVCLCVRSSVFAVLEFVRHWCPPQPREHEHETLQIRFEKIIFSTSTLPFLEVPRIKFQTMKPFFVCFPIGKCRVWIPKQACYLFAQAARQAQKVQQDLKAWPQRWDARPRIRRPLFFLVNTFRKSNIGMGQYL